MMKKTPFDIITLVIMMIICMRKELLGDDYNYVQMVGLMLDAFSSSAKLPKDIVSFLTSFSFLTRYLNSDLNIR